MKPLRGGKAPTSPYVLIVSFTAIDLEEFYLLEKKRIDRLSMNQGVGKGQWIVPLLTYGIVLSIGSAHTHHSELTL